MDLIPRDLESVYDECLSRLKSPEKSIFVRQLLSTAANFSSVYILLDALDECSSATLEDTITLIHRFKDTRIKVFCTFRPNLINLGDRFNVPIHSIGAHDEDVRNYLSARLNREWHYNKGLVEQIIDRLTKGAKGKLVSCALHSLSIGFCLSNFSWIMFWTKRNHEKQSKCSKPYRRTCHLHMKKY